MDANRAFCLARYSMVCGSSVRISRFAAFFYALVKSLAGFFAEPSAPHHFLNERGNFVNFARFVIDGIFVNIFDDVGENIEADNIGGAKCGRFRLADCGASAGVHFFDGHAHFGHEPEQH